ncbi:MAG: 50S ribosomal protein L29 [Deltaproteobacteria bacterium]|nr:50S ribosomal protein L29 [Deltaproteobacteria bacterium]
METKEIREMKPEEILQKRRELKQQIFHLRLSRSAGRLESPVKLKQTRRDLARLETVLREKELAELEAKAG